MAPLLSLLDTMDFSSMTLTQIKRQEMDSQVRGRHPAAAEFVAKDDGLGKPHVALSRPAVSLCV